MSGWKTRVAWAAGAAAVALVAVTIARESTVSAQEEKRASLPPDLVKVPGKAAGFVTIRPADLWDTEAAKGLRAKMGKDVDWFTKGMVETVGLEAKDIERLTLVMPSIGPGSGGTVPMFVAAGKPIDKKKVQDKVIPGGEAKQHNGKDYYTNDRQAMVVLDEKTYVVGAIADVQTLMDGFAGKQEGALLSALAHAAMKHSVVVGVNPEALSQIEDELPADAEPFKALLRAKVGTVTLDFGPTTKGQVRLAFPGADTAKAGVKSLEMARKLGVGVLAQQAMQLAKDPSTEPLARLVGNLEAALKAAKVSQTGPVLAAALEMKLEEKAFGVTLGEGLAKVRQAAGRAQSTNNLKQIGLAMHNYHDANGAFPPAATFNADGKPLLSWRVLILPYIEQDALYKEFKLDEPWDSAHNKKLIAKMPKVYQSPDGKPKNAHGTFYQGFYGPGAAFEGKRGIGITDVTDGTSNTILVVEGGKDVPWTKPEDLAFDAAKAVPKLDTVYEMGFLTTFADGSVRFIKTSIDKDTLKAIITRNGGEVVGGF